MAELEGRDPRFGVSGNVLRDLVSLGHACGEMTTAGITARVVKQATAAKKCAYIDVLRDTAPCSIGPVSVFVSHAWASELSSVVDALGVIADSLDQRTATGASQASVEAVEGGGDGETFYWFDPLINNAHTVNDKPLSFWCDSTEAAISTAGCLIAVLTHWNDAKLFTRSWCVYEIFCAKEAGAQCEVRMPSSQTHEFGRALLADSECAAPVLSLIDSKSAEAKDSTQQQHLAGLIASSPGGFEDLDRFMRSMLQTWFVDAAWSFATSLLRATTVDGPAKSRSPSTTSTQSIPKPPPPTLTPSTDTSNFFQHAAQMCISFGMKAKAKEFELLIQTT
eukprot:m.360423 g.360423  ORF g.360423 m.360423 type:complete len:336 (-) comp19040_c0_seq1:417-1424(-)